MSEGEFPMLVPGIAGQVRVPGSCCTRAQDLEACRQSPDGEGLVGCWAKFEADIEEHEDVILGVTIAVGAVMVLK